MLGDTDRVQSLVWHRLAEPERENDISGLVDCVTAVIGVADCTELVSWTVCLFR